MSLSTLGDADQPEGARGRLANLAYASLPPAAVLSGAFDELAKEAVSRFQAANHILKPNDNTPSGDIDAATKTRLEQAHDQKAGPLTN